MNITDTNLIKQPSEEEDAKKYQLLFEASEDPMWLIIDHKFEVCNDAAVRVLGYASQEELTSTHPSKLSPEFQADGKPSFDKAEEMMCLTQNKGYHRFEWLHTRKNGEVFDVEVTLTLIPHLGKDAIFCVWRDITERKQLEDELKKAIEEAKEANKSKSVFLSMMSHELRTPLNAVLGYSDMLKEEIVGPLNEKQMGTVNSIHTGGELLLHLVDDLLNMAQIEQGELNLNPEKIIITNIMDNSLNLIKDLAEKAEIKIHIEPVPEGKNCVYADRVRAEQILVNLLGNAIKYNSPGGNIWLSVKQIGDMIRFYVKDDGLGIHENHKDQVFEPFYRGEQLTSGIEGTGLGLSICRRLSQEMGGYCDFESSYKGGSLFWLDLPHCENCSNNGPECD